MSDLKKQLKLPSVQYGPICLKILNDFLEFHNLPKTLDLPLPGDRPNICLSKILDVMLHTMGQEKRCQIIDHVEEYNECIPPTIRY